jgi:hypothetical protein
MYELMKPILNEQLSSVEFVQDYLQLHFDGNTLTCFEFPRVVLNSKVYELSTVGYRDALCKIISHKVENVSLIEESHLEIIFEQGDQLILNLKRNDFNSDLAEFAYFTSIDNKIVVFD